jgi:hypothetical protein
MAYVACTVEEGLRPSEASVGVQGVDGRWAFLRVERDFVKSLQGQDWLPIGIVYRTREDGRDLLLIELPHEPDSGANRVWVEAAKILEPERQRRERRHDPVRPGNPGRTGAPSRAD